MGDVMRLELVSKQDVDGPEVGPLDVLEIIDAARADVAAGKVRSLFLAYRWADGAVSTKWAGLGCDVGEQAGLLEVLKFDLLRSRSDG